jgi:hypothetical protein
MAKLIVSVIPNAKKSEVVERQGGTWKIRLAAPPIEGRANAELVDFLSDKLDLPKSLIQIRKGLGSKTKTLEIPGNINDINERLT